MRIPSEGVLKILKSWYVDHGFQEMKSRQSAIDLAKREGAFGIENYLRALTDKNYVELLGVVKQRNFYYDK